MSKEELIHNLKSMADTYNFVTNGKDKSETEQTVNEIVNIIEKMDKTTFKCPHCECEYDILELIETGDMEGKFSMPCINCDTEFEVSFTTEIHFNIKQLN